MKPVVTGLCPNFIRHSDPKIKGCRVPVDVPVNLNWFSGEFEPVMKPVSRIDLRLFRLPGS